MQAEEPRLERAPRVMLSSWKEISTWLGVNPRTAQRWEAELGMPVHRVPGGGRVVAYADELAAWLAGQAGEETAEARRRLARRGARRYWMAAGAVAAALALWILPGLPGKLARRELAGWRVENGDLLALDSRGGVLWEKRFDKPLAEVHYGHATLPRAVVEDIDGDGRKELVFTVHHDSPGENALICWSDTGEEKWRWIPGRGAAAFPEDLQPPYFADQVLVLRLHGTVRLLAGAKHVFFPYQLALLDSQGRQLREYWHSGHIKRILAADLQGSGKPVILAAGIANGYKSADLVVLDPSGFGGVSLEESAEHQLPGPPPQELARVVVPRGPVGRAAAPFGVPVSLDMTGSLIRLGVSEEPEASTPPVVLFAFRKDLSLAAVSLASNYEVAYASLEKKGEIREPFDKQRILKELSRIRWLTPPDGRLAAKAR